MHLGLHQAPFESKFCSFSSKKPGMIMKRKIILLTFVFMLIFPVLVLANAGPVLLPNFPGISLIPVEKSQIKVLEEDIVYNVEKNTIEDDLTEDSIFARVNVKYLFKNDIAEKEKVMLAFPFDSSNAKGRYDIKILFDNQEVDYQLMSSKKIRYQYDGFLTTQNNEIDFSPDFTEVVSNLVEEVDKGLASPTEGDIKVILFELVFQPLEKHELEVSYVEYPSLEREHRGYFRSPTPWQPVFHYYLEPAKYWGSFKDLSITIHTPEGFPLDYTSLTEIEKVREGTYKGFFQELPDENLKFSLTDVERVKEDEIERAEAASAFWRFVFIVAGAGFLVLASIVALIIFLIKKKSASYTEDSETDYD